LCRDGGAQRAHEPGTPGEAELAELQGVNRTTAHMDRGSLGSAGPE